METLEHFDALGEVKRRKECTLAAVFISARRAGTRTHIKRRHFAASFHRSLERNSSKLHNCESAANGTE